ncbi:MAG: AraC-like DNA-binding protein [Candidatus Endobugula sp.]|jgi:AraC-like DNA-binding protein
MTEKAIIMSESPDVYRENPDPLSILLSRLELTAQVFAESEYCGSWAVDTSGKKKIPFHLIGSGEAWLHFKDDKPRKLSSGDLVVFPNDDSHIIANSPTPPCAESINTGSESPTNADEPITHMVCGHFEFRNPSIFPLLDALPSAAVLESNNSNGGDLIKLLVNFMIKEICDERPGHYTVIDQMAFLLFIEVIRQQVANQSVESGLLVALFDTRLGKVMSVIHQQPEHPWTLEILADTAAMSRSNFSQYFRKVLGITPMKYLTLWRMNDARRLLQTSSFSIAKIAERSGYESEVAFRKAFKNIVGSTPGSIRIQQKQAI